MSATLIKANLFMQTRTVYVQDQGDARSVWLVDIRSQGILPSKPLLIPKHITGPIIRISPIELHISDPEYYEILYPGTSGGARNKWQDYTRQFGTDESVFSTVDHRHHRLRRAALNPFFSKQRTSSLQGLIWSLAEKLCARFEEHRKEGSPVPLRFAYNSLTTQAITTYSFNQPWNLLDAKDYNPQYCLAVESITNISRYLRHVPWMYPILRATPLSIMKKLDESMGHLTEAIFRASTRVGPGATFAVRVN